MSGFVALVTQLFIYVTFYILLRKCRHKSVEIDVLSVAMFTLALAACVHALVLVLRTLVRAMRT
jgi:hypothetical protein